MPAIAYYCTAKTMTRSRGQNAVAAVAYRTGMKLEDERNEKQRDYTRKQGIDFILHAPPLNSPEWAHNIEQTWNAVEQKEVRSNSVVAREYIVAFPHELNSEQRELIVKAFVSEEFTRKNLISTSAIHAPNSEGDERNYHAHILFHDRPLFAHGFASHKDRSIIQKKFLLHIRDRWAELGAEQLMESGYSIESYRWREGHRPLEEQRELAQARGDMEYANELEGRQGTIHLGSTATALERKGIPTYRGDINRSIERGNKERLEAAKAVRREEAARESRRLEEELLAKEEHLKAARERLHSEAEERKKQEQKRAELERLHSETEERKKQEQEEAKSAKEADLEKLKKEAEVLPKREQTDLAKRVYLKADEFFRKMNKANYVSTSKTGEVKFTGHKRTIVSSKKESLFSIRDTQSGEELLRVRFEGNKVFLEKSLVTEDDLKLLENALKEFDRNQAKKSQTKDRGEDLSM